MRRTTAGLGIIGIAAALALSTPVPAIAHSEVVSSTPVEGEALTAVPASFALTTNEAMLAVEGGAGFAIQVTDAAGLFYGDGCLEVDGTTMGMGAGLGAAGDYTLTYQFVSADGHTVSDSYGFAYTPVGDAAVQTGLAEPPVCGEASVTGEVEPSPAPSEVRDEPNATALPSDEPSASEPATTEASDADEAGIVLGIVGAVLALLLVAGIVTAIVLRRRAAAAGRAAPPVD